MSQRNCSNTVRLPGLYPACHVHISPVTDGPVSTASPITLPLRERTVVCAPGAPVAQGAHTHPMTASYRLQPLPPASHTRFISE
eukprot:2419051-Prymnesium_polylepis.1